MTRRERRKGHNNVEIEQEYKGRGVGMKENYLRGSYNKPSGVDVPGYSGRLMVLSFFLAFETSARTARRRGQNTWDTRVKRLTGEVHR